MSIPSENKIISTEIADYARLAFRGAHDEARDNLEARIMNAFIKKDVAQKEEIEQARKETRQQCADAYINEIKDFRGDISPCFDRFIDAIRNSGSLSKK